MNVLGLYSDLGLFSTVYTERIIQFSNVEAHTTRKIFHTKYHTRISYGDPTMVYKHRRLMFNDYIDVRVYQTPPGDGR